MQRSMVSFVLSALVLGCGGSLVGTDGSGESSSPQATTGCLLLGGIGQASFLWDGTTWTAVPTAVPFGVGLNVGSLGGSLVVSGGANVLGGTWVWNGAVWSHPVNDATSPSPGRQSAAVAALSGKLLLFGGCESCGGSFGLMGDTWEWDGREWTELHPTHSPPSRFGAVMGTVAGKIVLFGGESYQAETFDDTWVWDGQDWSMASPSTSPVARVGASAAVASGRLLMFGGASGRDGALTPLGDTWSWDGTSWTEIFPPTSPSARWMAQMGSLRDTPVLFGGANEDKMYGDTWTWTGTTWAQAVGVMATPDSWGGMNCY